MPTLSLTEKNYWIAELTRLLDERQAKILLENPGVLNWANEEAKQKFYEERGVTALVELYNNLESSINALKDQKSAVSKELATKLGIGQNYYSDDSPRFADLNSNQYLEALRNQILDTDPSGHTWLQLQEQKKHVERRIMMATGSAAMLLFVREFCAEFGIVLPE